MKTIILLILILLSPIQAQAFEVKILGGEELWCKFKGITTPQWWTGFSSSIVTHELGHYAMIKHENLKYTFKDTTFTYWPESVNDTRRMGRSGFGAQILGGLVLKSIPVIDKRFMSGWDAGSLFLIGSYASRRGWKRGDLSHMSKGEYFGWVGLAIGVNLIEVKW